MSADRQPPTTVDEYIAGFPPEVQAILQEIRQTIRAAAPGAEERISYGMPAFAQKGILAWFAAHKKHVGLYPTSSGIEAFKGELAAYEGAKGTVRFPLDQPIPFDLIARIVRFRVKENLEKAASRARNR